MTHEIATEYNPSHPNSNIHGIVKVDGHSTCQTADGNLCTGCCCALLITHNSQTNGKILKEAGEMCEAQVPMLGCRHVLTNEPNKRYAVCPAYHCSGDLAKARDTRLPLKQRLAAFHRLNWSNTAALSEGEIDREIFQLNARVHIGETPKL